MKKILSFIFSTVLVLFSAAQNIKAPKDTIIDAVGYSHLDTQWRWDYQTTITDYIPNTMHRNFELFEKYPHYIFNFTGSNRYKFMKEYYPDDFKKVQEYVKEGRWYPNGSSVEENDVMTPSPESDLRQVLYGNEFFKKEFGQESHDYMIPDCFGFPSYLPTVLYHCGILGFSTQKLSWGSAVGIPFNIGLWVGPDDKSVVSVLNPGSYGTVIKDNLTTDKKWVDRIMDEGKKTGLYREYLYFGSGDIGGSPSDSSVWWVEKAYATKGPIKVISARADQLFQEITPEQKLKLPTYKGEFLLTNHSAGSINSAAFMKKRNRKNELLAYSAEASSVIADWLGGIQYPKDRLTEAWRLVLGAQFHDILPGTCIPHAYDFAWNDVILAANQFSNIITSAVGVVAVNMNTKGEGIPLVVYNSLAFDREDVVEATINFYTTPPQYIQVVDNNNIEVPSQIIKSAGKSLQILFLAKVPSVGFAVYHVRPASIASGLQTGLKITTSSLENSRYIVKVNSDGDIASIYDKTEKIELLKEPARLAFQYEKPAQWPAWNMDWADRKKPPEAYVDGKAVIKIVEDGPARIALQIERDAKGSTFIQQIRLSPNGAADIVEVKNNIDWFSKECCLKATFPLTVSNPLATYNRCVGTLDRPNNDSLKFEVPSYQWFDLTDNKGADYGVSVLEDCKYGSDKPSDNMLRLTLLYTPGVRYSYLDQASEDFGKHEIVYALYGHKGDWRDGESEMQAARLNTPLLPFQTTAHNGSLGSTFSFFKLSSPDITVLAVKKAENSDEIIIRMVENKGIDHKNVVLSMCTNVSSAKDFNGQEQPLANYLLKAKDHDITFDIPKYGMKTFAVFIGHQSSNLMSKYTDLFPVNIDYNQNGISYDNNKKDANIDNEGRSYPAEMLPSEVICDGVKFNLGQKPEGGNNVIACNGQKITLPSNNYQPTTNNYIYILAASTGGDMPAKFLINGKPYTLNIRNWSGFMGQWDKRIWDGRVSKVDYIFGNAEYCGLVPGYVKNDDIACFTTHRHLGNGENEPYIYCYMYKYKIPLNIGGNKTPNVITLPDNNKIKIFAITSGYNDYDDIIPAQALYDTLNIPASEYSRFQLAHPRPIINPANDLFEDGKSVNINIASTQPNEEIRYTIDGSEPSATSAKYAMPFQINNTTTIKAAIFKDNKKITKLAEETYSKCIPVKKAILISHINADNNKDPNTIIDLKRAKTDIYDDDMYIGYEGNDMEVVLDLGENKDISTVIIGCLLAQNYSIFLPQNVEISVSNNMKDYKVVKTEEYAAAKQDDKLYLKDITLNFSKVNTRYIKVKAKNIGKNPDWHKKKGEKTTLLVDEIMVQ